MSNHQKGTADKDHPCYPCKADLERLGLKAQGKSLGDMMTRLEKFKCFYCDIYLENNIERINHIDNEHHGSLHYPEPDDFVNRNER